MSVKSANFTIFNERSVIYTIQRNRIRCSEQWKEIVRDNYRQFVVCDVNLCVCVCLRMNMSAASYFAISFNVTCIL